MGTSSVTPWSSPMTMAWKYEITGGSSSSRYGFSYARAAGRGPRFGGGSDALSLDPLPERVPRRVRLGKLIATQRGAAAFVAGAVRGAGQPIDDVEPVELAPLEVPLALVSAVGVP